MNAKSLTQGFVAVPQSFRLMERLGAALTVWKRFCTQSVEEKKIFDYSGGVGYELKEFRGCTQDLKEDFHFTEAAYPHMLSLVGRADPHEQETIFSFLSASHHLMDAIVPTVYKIAVRIEDEYDLPGLESEVRDGQLTWVLRYLHYFGDRQRGEEIASAHVDKGGFTIHLFESNDGLEYLDYSCTDPTQGWKPMPVTPGASVVIPSMQLQYKTGGRLKALCHRVVATKETAESGRFSIVCFIPLVRSPRYDKKAKGRLQEFSPGFNYSMPHEEFAGLFV